MKKFISGSFLAIGLLIPMAASAHVEVSPDQVGVGSEQIFSTSVPNEKEVAMTTLRLDIPSGLKDVIPTAKTGWTVTTTKSGDEVTELIWSGGTIPAGQRDDFTFSAQAPATATMLNWKAHQTYADGTTVDWTQAPDGKDSEGSTPYSTTKVINDLTANSNTNADNDAKYALYLSIAGIALAVVALLRRR